MAFFVFELSVLFCCEPEFQLDLRKSRWYNAYRVQVAALQLPAKVRRQIHMEAYRSGHNGPDSKSGIRQRIVGSNPTASAKTSRTALAVLFVLINRNSGGIRKGVVASRRGDQNSPVDYFARAAKVCSHSTKKRVRRRAADAVRTYPPLPPGKGLAKASPFSTYSTHAGRQNPA